MNRSLFRARAVWVSIHFASSMTLLPRPLKADGVTYTISIGYASLRLAAHSTEFVRHYRISTQEGAMRLLEEEVTTR